jgi:hypothetical protein
MDLHTPLRPVTDADIEAYTAYRHKLATITTDGDPPPHRFRAWFRSRYQADPVEALLADQPLQLAGTARLRCLAAARST